jgi:prepilin-type N-terminal cleavage/methylation domain-containing protein
MKSKGNKQKGFSLIELLIVVAIILIIAAIAVPNLMAARMAAHESSAVGSLRTFNTAMIDYASQCPEVGYPADLTALGPGAGDCTALNAVDDVLGGSTTPTKTGYTFTYVAINSGGTTNDRYTLNADPASPGSTGTRAFFTDETGVIRYNQLATAGPSDAALQ